MADREHEVHVQQLKKARSSAKSKLTRKINIIKGLMNNSENLTAVKDLLDEAQDAVRVFNNAHEVYHMELKSVSEQQDSNEYRTCVQIAIKEFEQEIDSWLQQISLDIERSSARQPANLDMTIQAEDSISHVGSEASYHTRSSCNSYARSTTSDSTRTAARKAALEAEAETLKQLQELEIKELQLQHQKRKLELRCEIAAAEAEHSVYEKAEVGELDQLRPPTPIARSDRFKNLTEKPQSVADERELIRNEEKINSTPCCSGIKGTAHTTNLSEGLSKCKTNRAMLSNYSSSNSNKELWPLPYRNQACKSSVEILSIIVTLFVPSNISLNLKLPAQTLGFIT